MSLSVPEIIVRLAEAHDLDAIARFNLAMADETEAKSLAATTLRAGVEALFNAPQYGFYLVAEADKETLGCLLVTFEWSDWRNGLIWWIQSVYVRADWRRRGIYRRLYQAVKMRAECDGKIRGLRLYVEKDNATAQRTYNALGMRQSDYLLFEEMLADTDSPSQ